MNRRIRKKKDKKITEAINGLVSIAERREQQRQAAILLLLHSIFPAIILPPLEKSLLAL